MGINFGFQEGRGRVNFSSFLGYRRGDKPGTYEIVPAEAEIVRRIYRQYLEGFSPKMIADGLMEDGVCTPSGGEHWYPSAVASILENEKYAGDLLMQKWYVEDYLTHKCVKNSGEKPQYFVEDDHECCPYVNTFEPPQKARKLGISGGFSFAHPYSEHLI